MAPRTGALEELSSARDTQTVCLTSSQPAPGQEATHNTQAPGPAFSVSPSRAAEPPHHQGRSCPEHPDAGNLKSPTTRPGAGPVSLPRLGQGGALESRATVAARAAFCGWRLAAGATGLGQGA